MAVTSEGAKIAQWIASVAIATCPLGSAHAEDCPKGTTQLDLNECAGKHFKDADKALNATYQEILTRLKGDKDSRELLVGAQKAWLVFRDRECEFESSSTIGGSVHPMIVLECRATLTVERTKALGEMLHCQEGDLSCSVPPK